MTGRHRHVWTVFAACALLVFGALGYATWAALAAARDEARARHEAAVEEAARLALGRMDFAVALLLARESVRPYFEWSSFYPAQRSYAEMYGPPLPGEALAPSPLLTESSPFVLLHFQIDAAGVVSAPRVPSDGLRELAEPLYLPGDEIERAAGRLAQLSEPEMTKLAAQLPLPEFRPALATRLTLPDRDPTSDGSAETAQSAYVPQQAQSGQRFIDPQQQRQLSDSELQARKRSYEQYQTLSNFGNLGMASGVRVGPMQPLWQGERLLLARRVVVSKSEFVQGCWLDWEALRDWLQREISELAPNARLVPAVSAAAASQPSHAAGTRPERRMALLPARLELGLIAAAASPPWTDTHTWLAVGWGGVLLAVVAVAWLLAGLLALAERRAAFVSSVTHELRTPLTTFRIYTEMLAGGMVPDAGRQREYLETMQSEAVRLGHLVENVLGYARVERGRASGRVAPIEVGPLVDRAAERLRERAAQAGLRLSLDCDAATRNARVMAEATAVEQILFNLVDNACKYGRAEPREASESAAADIALRVADGGAWVDLIVRDRGAGVAPADVRRLFQPFHKSARDAAGTAPGVGLGLALSRRLARWMGGDLTLDRAASGACFVLRLRRAPA